MINLYNQDCMEAMAGFDDNQFDLAIVDPPYGINFAKTHTGKGWIVRENKEWDKEIPKPEYYTELFRVSKKVNYMGGKLYGGKFTTINGLGFLG